MAGNIVSASPSEVPEDLRGDIYSETFDAYSASSEITQPMFMPIASPPFQTRGAGEGIKPGVERSGTPGTRSDKTSKARGAAGSGIISR